MIRRALAIVAALLVLLAVLALHALPAASDVPVVSGVVPAGEFERVPFISRTGVTAGLSSASGPDGLEPGYDPATGPGNVANAGSPSPITAWRAEPSRTPSPSVRAVPSVAPVRAEVPTASVTGIASWFASPIGVSAAGPALRAALGAGWRGRQVSVCAGPRCVSTILGDWCHCGDRHGVPTVIDLDVAAFRQLAPLSIGVIAVEVTFP